MKDFNNEVLQTTDRKLDIYLWAALMSHMFLTKGNIAGLNVFSLSKRQRGFCPKAVA